MVGGRDRETKSAFSVLCYTLYSALTLSHDEVILLFALVASVMRMVNAPSMAALSVAHVFFPFLSISSTPLTNTTDCVLL